MYTEVDMGKLRLDESMDAEEDTQEKSLQWLLEMDLSEPEEKLFTVSGNEYSDTGLSAFEAELAGRPMVRGNAHGDDLANYVDEEIVISSADTRSDIYSTKDVVVAESQGSLRREPMAVDFSRARGNRGAVSVPGMDEGTDILGLAGDDDIGEKFLSIKRIKSSPTNDTVKEYATSSSEQEAGRISQPEVLELASEVVGVVAADDAEVQDLDLNIVAFDCNLPESRLLTEAPVPSQIADPDSDVVANDSGMEDAFEQGSVLDYVASIPQPEDDEAFDTYLLAGEHLLDTGSDPEELVIELSEGVAAVDPSAGGPIDYHDDFHALGSFSENAASVIAPVIGPIMEEISSAVRARLEALGVDADAVTVDVRLGSDEASIKQCYAQGYEPAHAVCFDLPQPLQSLEQEARDAIYVRLLNTDCNEYWNDLFSPDFVAFQSDGVAVEIPAAHVGRDDGVSLESPEAQDTLAVDWSLDDGFGEDIFGDDFADDFSTELRAEDSSSMLDIEEVFSGLSQFEEGGDDIGIEGFGEIAEAPSASALHVAEVEKVEEVSSAAQVEDVTLSAFDGTCSDGFIPEYINFNYTSQSNAEIFADFLDAFIEEGSVEVEKLEHEVGEWEKDVNSEPLFAHVSRTLHTVKGIAKGVGLHRLGTLVHNFETLLEKMPRPACGEEQAYFRIINAWLDAVVRGVEHVSDKRADIASELPVQAERAEVKVASVIEPQAEINEEAKGNDKDRTTESTAIAMPQQSEEEDVSTELASKLVSALEKKRDKQLADEGAKSLAAQQSVRMTSEKLDHLLNLTSQAQQLGVRAAQNTSRGKRSSAELQARLSSVRTHIRKIADRALLNVNAQPGKSTRDLDALEMDQYSELQEAASILREGVEDLGDLVDVLSRQNAQVEALLKQQSSVISSISSSIQGARVVPVSRLMPGLRRIVRTVSTDLGKIVSFQTLNETGALDRDHYARLQVILEHMVRNALDHGIESPEQRVALGKPTGGRITIDVRKLGGDYVIRLTDDGKGIDPDAIRHSAYEKGLAVDIDTLTDEEALRLIFHKGFSTASTLSEISGRGVGMDIVLTELQQIGGDIQIQSTVGLGTAFEVRIPSNVSVNGALLVAASGESYAIPLNGLISIEQVPVDEFFAAVEQSDVLSLSGMACKPTYLATLCQGVPLPDRGAWNTFVPVIIAGSQDGYMAIAIDHVEEALELVVRSLGSRFAMVPGVAGAATTAEGEAIVALDLNLMVRNAGDAGIASVAVSQAKATTMLALVVNDSRTQRMVATSQLDTVGVETITAENGLVAIDLLNATHRLPDVILLDVEMPVKDGIQTLREIRKSRRYGHLPVIMVTSRTGAKHRALASEAGCNAYMGKPFNFPALIKQINKLTGYELELS